MKKLLIIILLSMLTISLQGCVVAIVAGTVAAEIEYNKYSKRAAIETPDNVLSYSQYFKLTYPVCEDRSSCDQSKLKNIDWEERWAKQRETKEAAE